MKKFLQIFIVAVISCSIGVSCEKEEENVPQIGSMEDLLGTYLVSVEEDVIWGGSSGKTNDSGTIVVTRMSNNKVQLSGLISTQGELVDGNLNLYPETNIDSYGHLTTTYKSVLFGAGILTVWAEVSGQLATTPNGTRYPFSSLCYFEGKKQNNISQINSK